MNGAWQLKVLRQLLCRLFLGLLVLALAICFSGLVAFGGLWALVAFDRRKPNTATFGQSAHIDSGRTGLKWWFDVRAMLGPLFLGSPITLLMRTLQRGLSDLLNLFFRDPDDPATLWPWGRLAFCLGLLVLFGWLFVSVA